MADESFPTPIHPDDIWVSTWEQDPLENERTSDRRRWAFIEQALRSGFKSFRVRAMRRPLVVRPVGPEDRGQAVQAYRTIWYYADAYRERFTPAEARNALDSLEQCFIATDELENVVALAGGRQFGAWAPPETIAAVDDISRAYYFSEVGRVPLTTHGRIGRFLFELVMLTSIRLGYREFVLNTAASGDLYDASRYNDARQMYEDHGFRPLKDASGLELRRPIEQERAEGLVVTDWRPYYYATAESVLEAVGLPPGQVR